MLRIHQFLVRAQIGGPVDAAAIVAIWATSWDRDKTHARWVARLRMLDRRDSVVGNLIAAILKTHRATGPRHRLIRTAIDETRLNGFDPRRNAFADAFGQITGACRANDGERKKG